MDNFVEYKFEPDEVIGSVYDVSTGRILVKVDGFDRVKRVCVGRLAITESSLVNKWLIGRIEHVEQKDTPEGPLYYVRVGLVGSFIVDVVKKKYSFSRTLVSVPTIESSCNFLEGPKLSQFMHSVSQKGGPGSLTLGQYALDESVAAYMDGDKLFQRHMALVGSTGCGKSWTVATLVEQIATRPSANIIMLDIHGEYQALSYAMQYRMATPADLLKPDATEVLFMPAWFMTHEELMTIFLDKTDPDAPTQALLINEFIRKRKLEFLEKNKMEDIKKSFTVDSPVPYDFNDVLSDIQYVNTELVPGIGQGEVVKGPFYGKFDRFLPKLEAKMSDKRYGFMFSGPRELVFDFYYINKFVHMLIGTGFKGDKNSGVKILNFSMTPSEMLPVVIAVIGRFLFSVQFWNTGANRHPVVLFCDEAHLYLPPIENCNDAQKNTVFHFGRIAKEGRKYGIVLGVVTQRPSDMNATILSQCGNLMTLRLGNAIDQEVVKKLMPDGMTGLIEELPLMGIGELIAIGDSVILPLKIKVTPAKIPPTSITPTYCTAWSDARKDDGIDIGIDNMRKQFRGNAFD